MNHIIKRIEYVSDLLSQYRCVAGDEMYVEPHYDGTRISYLQKVGGGTKKPPIIRYPIVVPPDDLPVPIDPPLLDCSGVGGRIGWSVYKQNRIPPLDPFSGYVVAQARWSFDCLRNQSLSPKATYAIYIDDYGTFADINLPQVPQGPIPLRQGTATPSISRYDDSSFYLWAKYTVRDAYGSVIGINGQGEFRLD